MRKQRPVDEQRYGNAETSHSGERRSQRTPYWMALPLRQSLLTSYIPVASARSDRVPARSGRMLIHPPGNRYSRGGTSSGQDHRARQRAVRLKLEKVSSLRSPDATCLQLVEARGGPATPHLCGLYYFPRGSHATPTEP